MLGEALAGRSVIDAGPWEELDEIVTMVRPDLSAVISFASRPHDDAGVILWLYGAEEAGPDRVRARRIRSAYGRRVRLRVGGDARPGSSAVRLCPSGSARPAPPVRHRAGTHRALEAAGFVGSDDWRYIHRRLDVPWPTLNAPPAAVFESSDRAGWELTMRTPDGALISEGTIGQPVDGIGVLVAQRHSRISRSRLRRWFAQPGNETARRAGGTRGHRLRRRRRAAWRPGAGPYAGQPPLRLDGLPGSREVLVLHPQAECSDTSP